MSISKLFSLDLWKNKPITIDVKQNDAGRNININLKANGEEVDLTGKTVKYFIKKGDGNTVFNNCNIVEGKIGSILVPLTNQAITIEGTNEMELAIYDENGAVESTFTVYLQVTKTLIDDNAIESSNEFKALNDALGMVQGIDNKFKAVNSQLEHNTQQAIIKKVNPKLLPPPHVRAKGDGVTNDTNAISSALNLLGVRNDSNIMFDNRPGILELDEGVYLIDEILTRSNLTIRGQGIGKTILIPNIDNIENFFINVNYSGENKLCNFELENLSILKTIEHQFIIEQVNTRKSCSILDLTKCTSVRIKNVIISGFKGVAIRFKESFDTNIDNLQVIGCGDDVYNAIDIINSESDGSNALHFNGIRVEGCSAISIEGTNSKFNREVQFIGGKYEHTPIKIKGSSNINFCGGHFTYNKIEIPLISVSDGVDTETYGINFTGCSFLGVGTGNLCNNTSKISPKFIGCSFKGFKKGFTGSNINLTGNEFYDMTAPIVDSLINLKASNNEINYTKGIDGEYIFKIGSNSNLNNNEVLNNANNKLNGCLLNSDGSLVTDNFFMTCAIGVNVQGNSNRVKGNKGSIVEKTGALYNILEHYSSMNIPKNSEVREGNIKYDEVNKKVLLCKNGAFGNIVDIPKCENVGKLWDSPSNSEIAIQFNDLIEKLRKSGLMI